MTPQAAPAKDGVLREEKIEYRDQNGNLLNADQVKALEGKVSFSTRYETRTRYLDDDGKEVEKAGEPAAEEKKEEKAPHQPEVERVPGTKNKPEGEGSA